MEEGERWGRRKGDKYIYIPCIFSKHYINVAVDDSLMFILESIYYTYVQYHFKKL